MLQSLRGIQLLTATLKIAVASKQPFEIALAAGITSTVTLFPLETARTRLAVGGRQYGNVFQCLSTIANQEGLGAWYKVCP